jgi:hypothetical protein
MTSKATIIGVADISEALRKRVEVSLQHQPFCEVLGCSCDDSSEVLESNILAMNPYPRNFRVMQPMTSSWARAEMKKVMVVATGRDMWFFEAE